MIPSVPQPQGGKPGELITRIQTLKQSLPKQVRLLAVSKTFPSALIRTAYQAGIRDFGENKVQEAIAKQAELSDLKDITWHFIGHLQTNKARKALQHFAWIQSVDSLKLAEKLNTLSTELSVRPKCCLQVKILPDPKKYGFSIPELTAALPRLNQLESLDIQGLMVIPPFGLSQQASKEVFDRARALALEINQKSYSRLQIVHLSMGMSKDFSLAIASGATFIRLGTYLFGDRM